MNDTQAAKPKNEIVEHKQFIKNLFKQAGVHVTVNHTVDMNTEPNVGFQVTIRRKRTDKHSEAISLNKAKSLLKEYAHSITFKD
jgi:hypothetical protein